MLPLPANNFERPMKPFYLLPLTSLLCTACTAPSPLPQTTPETFGEPTGETRVQYQCSTGDQVEMRFFPLQGVGVLVRHGATIELQQMPAASGFVYSNGPNTVRGKGDELVLEIGRMVPIRCTAL